MNEKINTVKAGNKQILFMFEINQRECDMFRHLVTKRRITHKLCVLL